MIIILRLIATLYLIDISSTAWKSFGLTEIIGRKLKGRSPERAEKVLPSRVLR